MNKLMLVMVVFLAACSGSKTPSAPITLFTVKSVYAAALEAAVAYESLPRCSAKKEIYLNCSQEVVVDKLRKASDNANAAIKAAEAALETGGASEAALNNANDSVSRFHSLTKGDGAII